MNNSALWIVLHRMRIPFLVLIITYSISIVGFLLIDGLDNDGNIYHMSIFDAFYIVTYTATTIGFGEIPYPFTPAQRIWMSMMVYATVMGWFYSLGTLIALLQDKLLIAQLAEIKFEKQVKKIKQNFIIVLGYNYISKNIIQKANFEGIRVIVIEKDKHKANELQLENYTPSVPCLIGDVHDPKALEKAGIKSKYCKAVVALFENDKLNLRVALTTKLLNNDTKLAVKSTTQSHSEDLKDLGVEFVENPFELICELIEMSLVNPYMKVLQRWIYNVEPLKLKAKQLPQGKYIVCGFGRMGKILYQILKKHNIETTFIEPDKKQLKGIDTNIKKDILIGSADDKLILIKAGISEAVAIIAVTNNDTRNLSILTSSKKLNPNIVTITRENEVEDLSVFMNAKIDTVFIPARILINKTINYLLAPYSSKFLELVKSHKDKDLPFTIVEELYNKIGKNPKIMGLKINQQKAMAIYNYISNSDKVVKLDIFRKSLIDHKSINKIIPLLLIRKEEITLLPSFDERLYVNDKILFASDEQSWNDAVLIANNIYEFYYARTGKEKNSLKKIVGYKR